MKHQPGNYEEGQVQLPVREARRLEKDRAVAYALDVPETLEEATPTPAPYRATAAIMGVLKTSPIFDIDKPLTAQVAPQPTVNPTAEGMAQKLGVPTYNILGQVVSGPEVEAAPQEIEGEYVAA